MGVKLPSLNAIVLSGFDGAASVNGAKPPRTRPTAVVDQKPVKGRKTRTAKRAITSAATDASAATGASGTAKSDPRAVRLDPATDSPTTRPPAE
jgi:small conductance mechanosensitive channel